MTISPRRILTLWFLAILALSLVLTGCQKKPAETEPTTPEPTPTVTEPTPVPEPEPTEPKEVVTDFGTENPDVMEITPERIAEWNRAGVLGTVYFEYDSFDLTSESRTMLQANADFLRDNGPLAIRVEGNCDERGTIEYNLALGERRASAVRDYLVDLGVDATLIRIVSFGEENPAVNGHDDAAWSQNRRAEFVVESDAS